MYKKSSIKYLILFFTSIFLYTLIHVFITNKLSRGFESPINSIASKDRDYKLIELDNKHQVDFFYYDDDNDDDTEPKVKNNFFFTDPYSITKTLFFPDGNYSITKFRIYGGFTKKIFLMICVFRL